MESVFLSYTYRPHPEHADDLELLYRDVAKVVEAMGLRVIDGVDVGGRPLDDELRKRIESADALVALVTPQSDPTGQVDDPIFVLSEYGHASARGKATLRIIHHQLAARGLNAGSEWVEFKPTDRLPVVLKVMNTLALWKRELVGQTAHIRIEGDGILDHYDESLQYRCEAQLTRLGETIAYQRVRTKVEPGSLYAELRGLRRGDTVRLRIVDSTGAPAWRSRHVADPFVSAIVLERNR